MPKDAGYCLAPGGRHNRLGYRALAAFGCQGIGSSRLEVTCPKHETSAIPNPSKPKPPTGAFPGVLATFTDRGRHVAGRCLGSGWKFTVSFGMATATGHLGSDFSHGGNATTRDPVFGKFLACTTPSHTLQLLFFFCLALPNSCCEPVRAASALCENLPVLFRIGEGYSHPC